MRNGANVSALWIGVLLIGVAVAAPAGAQDKQEPALKGYCPASYLLSNEAVKGDPAYKSTYEGEVYYLANEEAKKAFDAAPKKYLPQFNGMCTTALGGMYGNRIVSDPKVFEIVDGKVYLFSSQRAKNAYDRDPRRYIEKGAERFAAQPKDAPVRELRKPDPQAANRGRTRPAMELEGKKVPSSSFMTSDGQSIHTEQLNNDANVLMFYASWCGVCKKSLPLLEKLAKSYEGKPASFLCISMDRFAEQGAAGPKARTKDQVTGQWDQMGLSLPQAFDLLKEGSSKFKVTGFPTFFLVDKSGEVERVYIGGGGVSRGTMKNDIDKLLAGEELRDREIATDQPARRTRQASTLKGKAAPKTRFTSAGDGSPVRIADSDSQATLAFFYTSWCGFCKKALPKVNEIAASYKGRPVRFLGINQDMIVDEPVPTHPRAKTKEQVIAHWKQLNLDFPQLLDLNRAGIFEYNVRTYPTMFLIDKSGKVEEVYIGSAAVDDGSLQRDIDKLLTSNGDNTVGTAKTSEQAGSH